jgi:hypothetical protein
VYTKEHTKNYVKSILDIVRAVRDVPDINKRLLIIAQYGEIASVMNDLLAASMYGSYEEINTAIGHVEDGLNIMMSDDDEPILFTGYADDDKPSA